MPVRKGKKVQTDGMKTGAYKEVSRNPVISFDRLQMYMGRPYTIDVPSAVGTLTIYQPTMGRFIDIGEKNFYSTLNIFTTNTTQNRLMLWDMGMDWTEISDYYLFTLLFKMANPAVTKCIFGDIDFGSFELWKRTTEDGKEVAVLYSEEHKIEINEEVYFHISQYLRNVFKIFPEELTKVNKILRKWYIDKDMRAREREKDKKKGDEDEFSIQPIISACVNHPGFKYKLQELNDVGVCEFWDSVTRLQIYEHSTALLKGMFSGMIDSKGINSKDYNFMREFDK